MCYCQDCGARNENDAAFCRICGHEIRKDRSSHLCTSCGEYLAPGAAFCSSCGAATTSQRQPHASLPISLGVETVVAAERPAAAARMEAVFHLSDGLDLPDWLKRAAAEQPYDPAQATEMRAEFPASAVFEEQTPETALADHPANGAAHAGSDAPHRVIPNGNLSTSLPAWLQQPPDASATSEPRPAPTPAAAEIADTTSFISESDLPEWIRQLAAAEEAKKAEEARLAATATTDDAPGTSGGRRILPGEIPSAEPVAQPWLARRERAATDAAMAETWSRLRPASQAAAAPSGGPEPAATPAAAEVVIPEPVASTPTITEGRPKLSTSRVLLVIAAVLAIITVIVALAFGV